MKRVVCVLNEWRIRCRADLTRFPIPAIPCSYLFITHDLSIIPTLARRVGVMQNGKLVGQGTAEQILTNPQHEYTKTLLNSVPRIE